MSSVSPPLRRAQNKNGHRTACILPQQHITLVRSIQLCGKHHLAATKKKKARVLLYKIHAHQSYRSEIKPDMKCHTLRNATYSHTTININPELLPTGGGATTVQKAEPSPTSRSRSGGQVTRANVPYHGSPCLRLVRQRERRGCCSSRPGRPSCGVVSQSRSPADGTTQTNAKCGDWKEHQHTNKRHTNNRRWGVGGRRRRSRDGDQETCMPRQRVGIAPHP